MTADLTPIPPTAFLAAPDQPAAPREPGTLLWTDGDLADLCDHAELLANVQDDGSIIYADHAIDVWAHADGIDFTDGRAGGTLDYGVDATVVIAIIDAVRKAAQR